MNSREFVEDPLYELDEDERAVVSAICDAFLFENQHILTAKEIAKRLYLSESETRNRLTRIYKKLKIEGSDNEKRFRLIYKLCKQQEGPPQNIQSLMEAPLQKRNNEENRKQLENESIEREQKDEVLDQLEELSRRSTQPVFSESPPPARPRRNFLWIAIGTGIVFTAVAVAVIIFLTGVYNPDQLAANSATNTSTIQPSKTISPILLTEKSAFEPITSETTSDTSRVTSQFTNTPAAVIVETSLPTSTDLELPLSPTTSPLTSTPTNTRRPSPTPILVLFEDDFENGLDPAWETVEGQPYVSNGSLAASQWTVIMVGDLDWTNYIVEIKAQVTIYGNPKAEIGFRAQDWDNYIGLKWMPTDMYWIKVENGNEIEIPNTRTGNLGLYNNINQFRIIVDGENFTASLGTKRSSIFLTTYPSGKVMIGIPDGIIIHSIKIIALP